MSTRYPIPTRGELQCGGISFIISQILWMATWSLQSIDFDAYAVKTEEEVIKLHNIVSSDVHRMEIEISCALMWISFPFTLAGIFTITKLAKSTFTGTTAESLMYVAEKAWIIFIAIALILIPALSLVSVSYDWSFYESTAGDAVPTGYWIQLYVIIFEFELIDCATIADGTFMLCYFMTTFYFMWSVRHGNPRFALIHDIVHGGLFKKCKDLADILSVCCFISLAIIFLIVLFEFAETGFFSPTGYAGWAYVWSMIAKIFIGIRMVNISKRSIYDRMKKIYENDYDDQHKSVLDVNGGGGGKNYQMETINVNDQPV